MIFADSLADWAQILTAIGTLLGIVVSAVAAFMSALAKIQGNKNAIALAQVSDKHDALTENVTKIEVATNSMKDALVKATGDASFAAGREEGRNEGLTPKK